MSTNRDFKQHTVNSRKYQEELNRFVEETRRSEQQSINGEAKPLDMDALRLRLEKRLADERLAKRT